MGTFSSLTVLLVFGGFVLAVSTRPAQFPSSDEIYRGKHPSLKFTPRGPANGIPVFPGPVEAVELPAAPLVSADQSGVPVSTVPNTVEAVSTSAVSPAASAELPSPDKAIPSAVTGSEAVAPSNKPAEPVTPAGTAAPAVVPGTAEADVKPIEPTAVLPSDVATVAAASPVTCTSKYVQTDIRPLRNMWTRSQGFCGETSMQMILMTRGVWLGQGQARTLSGCPTSNDLILYDRTDVVACSLLRFMRNKLGFDTPDSAYWDSSNQRVTNSVLNPPATAYLQWVKQHIIAGRPVIVAVRLKGETDPTYDHLIPVFGVCSTNVSASAPLLNTDVFSMSTDIADEVNRSASDPGMFAKQGGCPYAFVAGQAGCIPSDTYNYGMAVGQLKDTNSILVKTTKLTITAWSNGFGAQNEPGEKDATGSSTASYTLSVWKLTPNATYTTWRMDGLLPVVSSVPKLPASYAEMLTRCTSLGATKCRSSTYTAPATGAVVLSQTALGTFAANSLQYFFTVRKP